MLILALQFWKGDRDKAAELARFIADLEPTFRDDVIFVLAGRQCEIGVAFAEKYLEEKFTVHEITCDNEQEGWPSGPNALALFVMEQAPELCPLAFGLLMLEADCVSLQRDWINQIILAWQLAFLEGAWQMGSWRDSGGQWGHINGCCVIRPDIAKLIDLKTWVPRDLAWDAAIAPFCKDHWCKSGLFLNKFQSSNATEAELRTPEIGGVAPVLVHGYKDRSALEISRRWNLLEAKI